MVARSPAKPSGDAGGADLCSLLRAFFDTPMWQSPLRPEYVTRGFARECDGNAGGLGSSDDCARCRHRHPSQDRTPIELIRLPSAPSTISMHVVA